MTHDEAVIVLAKFVLSLGGGNPGVFWRELRAAIDRYDAIYKGIQEETAKKERLLKQASAVVASLS